MIPEKQKNKPVLEEYEPSGKIRPYMVPEYSFLA